MDGETPPSPESVSAPAGALPARAERCDTAKGQVATVDLNKLQATRGRRMAEAKATVPHFLLRAEIDMSH